MNFEKEFNEATEETPSNNNITEISKDFIKYRIDYFEIKIENVSFKDGTKSKITLTSNGKKYIDNINWDSSRSRTMFINKAVEELGEKEFEIKRIIDKLNKTITFDWNERFKIIKKKESKPLKLKEEELKIARDPNLTKYILDDIHKRLVGESANAMITFFSILSAKTDDPQNLKFSGDSSIGKSKIVTSVLPLFPKEQLIVATGLTKKSVYYDHSDFDENGNPIVDLEGISIIILEEGSSEEFLNEIKPLLSHDKYEMEYRITEKVDGQNKTIKIKIRGWPSYIGLSVKTEREEEFSTREWLATPIDDVSKFKLVNEDTGMRNLRPYEYVETDEMTRKLKRIIKSLKKMRVIIPYAKVLTDKFPHNQPRVMRDLKKLLALIKISAILHQYQRDIYEIKEEEYIIANEIDYEIGMGLAKTMMESTFSGIPNDVKKFYFSVMKPLCEELDEADLKATYGDMMKKYKEVYGRSIARKQLREKFTNILVDKGLLNLHTDKKPYSFSISDMEFESLGNFGSLNDLTLDHPKELQTELNNIGLKNGKSIQVYSNKLNTKSRRDIIYIARPPILTLIDSESIVTLRSPMLPNQPNVEGKIKAIDEKMPKINEVVENGVELHPAVKSDLAKKSNIGLDLAEKEKQKKLGETKWTKEEDNLVVEKNYVEDE